MKKRKYLCLFLFLGMIGLVATDLDLNAATLDAKPDAENVEHNSKKAVEIRKSTQKAWDDWIAEENNIKQKIARLEEERTVIEPQVKRVEAYIRQENHMVQEYNRRIQEYAQLRTSLEPVLDESFDKLSRFLDNDLPFKKAHRKAKLKGIETLLDTYNADLADKMKPLLDALAKEVSLNSSVKRYAQEIEVNGVTRRVSTLRTGRIGLFAISMDKQKAWRYNPKQKQWEPLKGWAHEINKAIEIVSKERIVDLVKLPFGTLSDQEKQP